MKNLLLVAGLVLAGCSDRESKLVDAGALQDYRWVSQEHNLSFIVTPTSFVFVHEQPSTVRIPYRTLSNQRILLSNDTVMLYLKEGKTLRIEPLSKEVWGSESIWVGYATDFLRQEK